jgi:hypothetical protein
MMCERHTDQWLTTSIVPGNHSFEMFELSSRRSNSGGFLRGGSVVDEDTAASSPDLKTASVAPKTKCGLSACLRISLRPCRLLASTLHQTLCIACVRRHTFGDVFYLTVTQTLSGNFVHAQLTLCPHSPQIYSRTNVPAQRVHGGLLGGMSHVEKSELDKPAILISVADAHDPRLSCQFHHHSGFWTPSRKSALHRMLDHPFAQLPIRIVPPLCGDTRRTRVRICPTKSEVISAGLRRARSARCRSCR